MKSIIAVNSCIFFAGIMIFSSCKKEYSCEGCADKNKPPIAIAGPDQVITLPTDSVLLDGNASSDPDGRISDWLWTKISGPASFNVIRPSDSVAIVKTLIKGTYQFELKVTDNDGLSAKDTVQIIVNDPLQTNRPPVACAGVDQTITLPANAVNLDGGCSTDPDNNITSFMWTKISGPSSFNIANSNVVQTQVTNLVQGVYRCELKVIDSGGLFSKDTMTVTVALITSCLPTITDSIYVVQGNSVLIPFGLLSQARSDLVSATAGNKILFAGGWLHCDQSSSRVDIFDMITQTWSTAELSEGRYGLTATAVGNKILIAGGANNPNQVTSRVDIYDASANSWSTAELSIARSIIASATIGNKAFFAGGFINSNTPNSSRVDIYDASTNSWSISELSEGRFDIATASVGNKLFFGGGNMDDGQGSYGGASSRVDIYDASGNTWSTDALSEARGNLAAIALNNKVFFAGGYGAGTSSMVDIYDNNLQSWSTANLSQARAGFGAASLGNKILFFTQGTRMDIYHASSNTWTTADLNLALSGSTVIRAGNQVYVAGGSVSNGFTNKVWQVQF